MKAQLFLLMISLVRGWTPTLPTPRKLKDKKPENINFPFDLPLRTQMIWEHHYPPLLKGYYAYGLRLKVVPEFDPKIRIKEVLDKIFGPGQAVKLDETFYSTAVALFSKIYVKSATFCEWRSIDGKVARGFGEHPDRVDAEIFDAKGTPLYFIYEADRAIWNNPSHKLTIQMPTQAVFKMEPNHFLDIVEHISGLNLSRRLIDMILDKINREPEEREFTIWLPDIKMVYELRTPFTLRYASPRFSWAEEVFEGSPPLLVRRSQEREYRRRIQIFFSSTQTISIVLLHTATSKPKLAHFIIEKSKDLQNWPCARQLHLYLEELTNLPLPEFEGARLEEHFRNLGAKEKSEFKIFFESDFRIWQLLGRRAAKEYQ